MTPSSIVVEINGKRYAVAEEDRASLDCRQIDDNQFHLIEEGRTHAISILNYNPANRSCTLQVDGEVKEVRVIRDLDLLIEKMGLNATRSKKLSALLAPMPGLVTAIRAESGQQVEKGDPILILEAMKMENMIVAPHDARIKVITVQVGQAVDKGALLVEFEPG